MEKKERSQWKMCSERSKIRKHTGAVQVSLFMGCGADYPRRRQQFAHLLMEGWEGK